MIAGIFHEGSGLGNQLFRYVATRVLAEDKGYEWGMIGPERFKGRGFLSLATMGVENWFNGEITQNRMSDPANKHWSQWHEKKFIEGPNNLWSYDPEINFVQDNTIIDGEFQDERYFKHRLPDINKWLAVEPLELPDDLCVLAFRGGEYTLFRDLFLPKSYWEAAIEIKRRYKPNMRFQVHTDDVVTAKSFFPDYECIHDIGLNWRSIRYAKHLILSNSSFGIFPALLNESTEGIIAPRYWARHNTGIWSSPANYYSKFNYI